MGNEGTGDAFRIFATVMAIMNEWISKVGIERVQQFDFNADKDEHDSDGRSKLYDRFAKKLASQLGWSVRKSEVGNGSADFFSLQNPNPQKNEESPFGVLTRKAGHVINKSHYVKAAEMLHKILKRKYDETGGKLRHTLGYYAQMIANQTGNKINWRELQAEYLDQFGNTMFENFADGKKKGKSRPGRVKRAGASCKGSVTSLRKKAKNASGEKAKMYHWCANMKSGKNKSK